MAAEIDVETVQRIVVGAYPKEGAARSNVLAAYPELEDAWVSIREYPRLVFVTITLLVGKSRIVYADFTVRMLPEDAICPAT